MSCRSVEPPSSSSPPRPSVSPTATASCTANATTLPVPLVVRLTRFVRVPYRPYVGPVPARDLRPRRRAVRLLPRPGRDHRPRDAPQPGRRPRLGERRRRLRPVQPHQGRQDASRTRLAAACHRRPPPRGARWRVLGHRAPDPRWAEWLDLAAAAPTTPRAPVRPAVADLEPGGHGAIARCCRRSPVVAADPAPSAGDQGQPGRADVAEDRGRPGSRLFGNGSSESTGRRRHPVGFGGTSIGRPA